MSREDHDRLGTADLVAGADQREARNEMRDQGRSEARDEARAEARGDVRNEMRQDLREPRAERPAPQQQVPHQGMPQQQVPHQGMPQQPQQQMPAAQMPQHPMPGPEQAHGAEPLAALFPPQVAQEFRGRWDQVQIGFVDDPRRAVQQADELVAQVMKSLAATFADQRARLEAGLGRDTAPDTEDLRVALRGYRSFFQRLLSL